MKTGRGSRCRGGAAREEAPAVPAPKDVYKRQLPPMAGYLRPRVPLRSPPAPRPHIRSNHLPNPGLHASACKMCIRDRPYTADSLNIKRLFWIWLDFFSQFTDKCHEVIVVKIISVSYTHLDVYKRQVLGRRWFRIDEKKRRL